MVQNGTGTTAQTGQAGQYPWLTRYPQGVDWHQSFNPFPLGELLDQAATNFPNATCTNFLGTKATYAEINRLTERAAKGLQNLGVIKGMKVGLFLPNSPTFIIYYFAILRAGGTVVNFNPLYTLEELTNQVRDSETQLMVTLDLKILFDKVEELIRAGTLPAADRKSVV